MKFHKYLILSFLILILSCSRERDDDPVSRDNDFILLDITTFPNREQDFSLWQLDMLNQLQMSYILRTDDSKITVIDGGLMTSGKMVENYLMQLGGEVDTWIITHPHEDHAGALLKIIQDKENIVNPKIRIKKILHVAHQEDWVKKNESKLLPFFSNYMTTLENSKIPVIEVKKDDFYTIGDGVEMKVIGAKNEAITANAINNSSMVFMIQSQSKKVLFLGDLGIEGGNEILKNIDSKELKADFVQMAHHGQNGVDKLFYESVQPCYTLWPTPIWLWNNDLNEMGIDTGNWKTPIVREWMKDLKVKKNYVAGIEGTIQID